MGKWAVERGHGSRTTPKPPSFTFTRSRPRRSNAATCAKRWPSSGIFPDSHVTLAEFAALLLSNVGRDMVAAMRQRRILGVFADILVFRSMQYWGTYRGMNYRSPLTHELISQVLLSTAPRAR